MDAVRKLADEMEARFADEAVAVGEGGMDQDEQVRRHHGAEARARGLGNLEDGSTNQGEIGCEAITRGVCESCVCIRG